MRNAMQTYETDGARSLGLLFWTSAAVTLYNILDQVTWSAGPRVVVMATLPALAWIYTAGCIWYLVLIRKKILAIIGLAGIVASRSAIFAALPQELISDPFWLVLHAGPTALLVVALGLILAPTFSSWRRCETEHLIQVFE